MDIFVINKNAGQGKSLVYLDDLETIYDGLNEDYTVLDSNNALDMEQKVKHLSMKEDTRYIYSIGGDGTLNSVVNGMIESKKPLIVIPAGSGNDFYRGIKSFKEDMYIDVGIVNDRYFLGSVSLGIDALVADYANKLKEKNYKGNPYFKGALEVLKKYESFDIDMFINKVEYLQKTTLLAISNNSYYGRGIKVSPNASLIDGKLNVCLVNDMPNKKLYWLFLKLLLGLHENDFSVFTIKTEEVLIRLKKSLLYSFDGEMRTGKEINVGILPKQLFLKREINPAIQKLCQTKK